MLSKKALQQAQAVVEEMVGQLVREDLPPLGPGFARLAGVDLHSALVSHRIVSKFERPQKGQEHLRSQKSIQKFLAVNQGCHEFNIFELSHSSRCSFFKAQAWLKELFKGFRPTFGFAFPSGESFHSEGGDTDFLDKLERESQWTVSGDLLNYAASVAYNTRYLKKVVKARFRNYYSSTAKTLERRWASEYMHDRQIGKKVFSRMFASVVDIVGTARVTTVPKNNTWDRVITCEPTWTMVAQLSFAYDVRERLRVKTGIDISFWQQVHRALIRSGRATIDFSDASDRNSWSVVKHLFPPHMVRWMKCLRTSVFEVEGDFVPSNMLAPMGAGITFDLLTVTLLAYSKVFDPGATVFGDDVILDAEKASEFMEFTEELGWKVNREKSFHVGNFRESCGAFCDLENNRLLESFDVKWFENTPEAFIVVNKIRLILDSLGPCRVRTILLSAYTQLLGIVPRDSLVDDPFIGLSDWLVYSNEPEDFDINNVLIQTWSQQWQRPIRIARRVKIMRKQIMPRGTSASVTETAAYLRAGRVYGPPRGKPKLITVKHDTFSGVGISNVCLVNVI